MSELAKWMVSEPSNYLSWLTDSRRMSDSNNELFINGVRVAE